GRGCPNHAEPSTGRGLRRCLTVRDEVVNRRLAVRIRLQCDDRRARHARLRGAAEDAGVTLVDRNENWSRAILTLRAWEREDRRVLILLVCRFLFFALARL